MANQGRGKLGRSLSQLMRQVINLRVNLSSGAVILASDVPLKPG